MIGYVKLPNPKLLEKFRISRKFSNSKILLISSLKAWDPCLKLEDLPILTSLCVQAGFVYQHDTDKINKERGTSVKDICP